jgi:hypothetical protein
MASLTREPPRGSQISCREHPWLKRKTRCAKAVGRDRTIRRQRRALCHGPAPRPCYPPESALVVMKFVPMPHGCDTRHIHLCKAPCVNTVPSDFICAVTSFIWRASKSSIEPSPAAMEAAARLRKKRPLFRDLSWWCLKKNFSEKRTVNWACYSHSVTVPYNAVFFALD